MGQAALAHLRALDAAVANVAELEHALGEAFAQHPDAAIITSFPGLGIVLGARILGEIGDDRPGSPTPKPSKRSPGPRRSPEHRARRRR